MDFCLQHPRDQIVEITNRIYAQGMTTTSGGNLSILDDNGDMWVTPAGVDKGNLRVEDIVCVKPDLTVVGRHAPSSEFRFHRAIYQTRNDIRAVVHAHPAALVSFSIARKVPDTRIAPSFSAICGAVGRAPYAMMGSTKLAQVIAETFASGFNCAIMDNHGAVTAGCDLLQAFQRFETLDFCARTVIYATRLGGAMVLDDEQLSLTDVGDLAEFVPSTHSSVERSLRKDVCEIVHRGYAGQLMTGTTGTVSARVGEDLFVITPSGVDRKYLDIEDLVLISKGRREKGKQPSRSVRLHRTIYHDHAEIGAIVMSQAPYTTAHCVAGVPLDATKMSEGYVILGRIPMVPFGTHYLEGGDVSALLSERTNTLLLQHDGALTTGSTIVKAFDRLEVAEFAARALSSAPDIGEIVPINAQGLEALDNKFFA
jgi:L-fuculose-phosphate aldolase